MSAITNSRKRARPGSDEVGRCGGIAPGGDCRRLLYRDIMLPLRALAVVILIAAAGGVALEQKVKLPLLLPVEARTEVRKVIWPTRQETLHTTLIVAAVTAVMSLILLGTGWYLVLVSFITGLRF